MPTEEQMKDYVLQQVNDVLDQNNWGGSTDLLVVEIVFEKTKFDFRIRVKRNEPKKLYTDFALARK